MEDFLSNVRSALSRSGFVSPDVGEARVLVFDSRRFSAQTMVAAGLLGSSEARRAERFRFDHDRRTYIAAHAVWRVALAFCLHVEPAKLALTSTPAGQPRLPGTRLSTSLSHSGSWVAMAVCGGESVGIDIECSPPRIRVSDLIEAICTPGEILQMMKLDAEAREAALLALWTRKEALLKAFGVGLAEAMLSLPGDEHELVAAPPSAAGLAPCRANMLSLGSGLVGALAVPAEVTLAGSHQVEPT